MFIVADPVTFLFGVYFYFAGSSEIHHTCHGTGILEGTERYCMCVVEVILLWYCSVPQMLLCVLMLLETLHMKSSFCFSSLDHCVYVK